jgi:heat shock protein HslJ
MPPRPSPLRSAGIRRVPEAPPNSFAIRMGITMPQVRLFAPIALSIALAGCAATESGTPIMPGSINAPPPPMAAPGDSLLTNTVWTWQGTQMSNGDRIVPEAADRYALMFRPGGMVEVRADCNRGSASYLLTGGQMTFGAVALTKMLCPPGSRDTEFLRELGAVTAQGMNGPDLTLTLGGGGMMRFTTTRQ